MSRVFPRLAARAVLAAGVVLCLVPVAAADAAGISGRVIDRAGDPVPGATVTFRGAAATIPLAVLTDESGRFLSPALDAGSYAVEATLPGCATTARLDLALGAGERRSIDLRLDVDMVHERALVRAPSPDDSLESREIRESFARDAGESLVAVDGIARVRKGAIANDVVLRGLKGENLGSTIDGARVHGACPGKMDPPTFHADFAEIERVDVVKGPFDVTNQGALAGSVNVVTRRPAAGLHGSAQVAAGSYDYVAPSVVGSFANARAGVVAGYSRRQQDPYEDGDGVPFTESAGYTANGKDQRAYAIDTYWIGGNVAPAPGHFLEAQGTIQRVDGALYPYLLMDALKDDADRVRLAYTGPVLAAAVSYVGVDHDMDDRFRVSSANRPRGYSMATFAASSVLQESVSARWGGLTLGVQAYQRNWDATNEMFMAMSGQYAVQAAIPDVDTNSAGIYATWERGLGSAVTMRLAGRVDYAETEADPAKANTNLYLAYHGTTETSSDDTLPAASVLFSWKAAERWTVFGGGGRATRVPSAEERYFAQRRGGADWVGNPLLDPVTNDELDAGVAYRATRVGVDVTLFHSWLGDFITLYNQPRISAVPGVSNVQAKSYAAVEAKTYGGEATVRWAVTGRIAAIGGVSYTRGVQEVDPARNIHDADLPEIPPLSGRLAVRYESGGWFVEAEEIAAARQDHINSDVGEIETAGYGVTNLRGGITRGPFSIVLGIDNLFDKLYRESLSYARDPFRSGTLVMEPGLSVGLSVLLRR